MADKPKTELPNPREGTMIEGIPAERIIRLMEELKGGQAWLIIRHYISEEIKKVNDQLTRNAGLTDTSIQFRLGTIASARMVEGMPDAIIALVSAEKSLAGNINPDDNEEEQKDGRQSG